MRIHRSISVLIVLAALLLQPVTRAQPSTSETDLTPNAPAAAGDAANGNADPDTQDSGTSDTDSSDTDSSDTDSSDTGVSDSGSPAGGGTQREAPNPFRTEGETPAAAQGADIERLLELGQIQRRNGEYIAASRTLQQALQEIRKEHGAWDQRNVQALSEFAAARAELGELEEAVGLYQQAVHINRTNKGLHDDSQLDMLDAMTELHVRRSEWEEANQLQEYAYYVREREYGANSPALLPGLYQLAEWYRRTGSILRSRMLYEKAVAIIEANYGPMDIRLVDALRGLAATYRLERYPVVTGGSQAQGSDFSFTTTGGSRERIAVEDARMRMELNRYRDGEDALERVVGIIEEREDTSPRELARALLDLADWYLIFDDWSDATETYARAYQRLEKAGWSEQRLQQLFGEPQPVVFPLPEPNPPRAGGAGLQRRQGHVQLEYDVSHRGRIDNVEILSAEPEDLLNFRVLKALRVSRFRPRLVDGEPVETTGVQYRHSFVYWEERDGPAQSEPPENGASPTGAG